MCPHCVYIGVPAKKALQFFVERLQGNIAVETYSLDVSSVETFIILHKDRIGKKSIAADRVR